MKAAGFAPGLALSLGLLLSSLPAAAQVLMQADAQGRLRYEQGFDSLPASGAPLRWVDNQTLPGWFLFNWVEQPLVTPTLRVDEGRSASGSFYSYGRPGERDRALGAVGTGGFYFGTPAAGTQAGYIALALRHAAARPVQRLRLAFMGEQWRQGASDDVNQLVFEYGIGERMDLVERWVRPGSGFDFDSPSPELVTDSGSALDGHGPAASRRLGGLLTGLDWRPGQLLWLRWGFLNNHGFDHGLALDKLSLVESD